MPGGTLGRAAEAKSVTVTLRFLADEDFRRKIIRGLRRRLDVDVVRVQDVDLAGEEDPVVLDWAAQQNRIILTHDVRTMPSYAYDRVVAGLRMPGVCVVPQSLPLGPVIEDLVIVLACSTEDDWENQVRYLPL
jgi:uncharacterized protein DUF5615